MVFKKSLSLIFSFTLLSFLAAGEVAISKVEKEESLFVLNSWMEEITMLTKNCVGFSAPVSARAFCYMSVGMYESQVEMMDGYQSLTGRLQGYNRTAWKGNRAEPNWPHVANTVMFNLANFFYRNMPPANAAQVNRKFDALQKYYANGISNSSLNFSEKYGQEIAAEIIAWSRLDNGDAGYNANFPENYIPQPCKGCWSQTGPGYLPALQPYWGNNRLMLASNAAFKTGIPFVSFSADTASAFYKGAAEIVSLYDTLQKEHKHIAKYWDDSPGYSGTPAGHLFSIALQLSKNQRFSLEKTLHLYALLGIAINDANIECWNLKYHYNLIRPITYIQQYISKDFNTVLSTPPFPEFPSGHSFQSGAASKIFIYFFGDAFAFSDSTNLERHDLAEKMRKFKSFSAMAEEISISRFYGGIHFRNTLSVSLQYGRKIGDNCINSLQFFK